MGKITKKIKEVVKAAVAEEPKKAAPKGAKDCDNCSKTGLVQSPFSGTNEAVLCSNCNGTGVVHS